MAMDKRRTGNIASIRWKDGCLSINDDDGCSKVHQAPLAAAKMHKIKTRLVMILASRTDGYSCFPRGRSLERPVLPLDLTGIKLAGLDMWDNRNRCWIGGPSIA